MPRRESNARLRSSHEGYGGNMPEERSGLRIGTGGETGATTEDDPKINIKHTIVLLRPTMMRTI